ncbi:LysR family transcriptional regulator [Polyangium sp. y55x31]|uniref:LysR family transcriptional regulator n=1 Tax=Polyangium sp. y55x31 TaxID=3042688 RepID=UPI002482E87F|nr:LysR family transcriptional regulator [Polyangium sp. y55x31]MDI1475930.1 LysR family transcriptional regulator [Polyangium sp. y55x31]
MDFLGRARTLVRIVEAGSFSSAARSLGLSLAAISRQIGTLEEELGAKLFVRTTRSLHLTDEGRRFFEHATRLVREADAAMASVRPDRAIGGRVVVSASVTLGVMRIVPALPALLDAHPALELEMRLEDHEAELVGEGVDIAVRAGMALPDTTNLVAQSIATFPRVLVASPAYLRRHGLPRTVDSLASHAAVLGLSSPATWHFVEDGEKRTVTMVPKLRVATLLGIRSAVEAGLGIAAFPDFVVKDAMADGSLRVLLPEATLPLVPVYALYRIENRGSPRIDAIASHLRATLPTEPAPAPPARGRRRA